MSFCFIRKFQSVFIHIFDFYVKFIRVGSTAALLFKNIRGFCNSVNAKAPFQLAERVRFELTVLAYTRFPGVHLKPLGHLSSKSFAILFRQAVLHKRSD